MTNTKIELHLISDSTGETVSNVAKSVMAGFENVKVKERHWTLIRKEGQIDNILEKIRDLEKEGTPSIVMYTMVSSEHCAKIEGFCAGKGILAINVLADINDKVAAYLNEKQVMQPGRQHEVNSSYLLRIDALNYTLHHDDGQNQQNLSDADIIIVGVSRTSKSPTSIYLAYRGYKCANIPLVSYSQLPEELSRLEGKLIVGLTINPERLVEIRKQRVSGLGGGELPIYTDIDAVTYEVEETKKLFRKKEWPVIDVTKRSIEETAAKIIQLYEAGQR